MTGGVTPALLAVFLLFVIPAKLSAFTSGRYSATGKRLANIIIESLSIHVPDTRRDACVTDT